MVSSGLLRRVALVRTHVSEEPGASFIRVTKICELGTTQATTSNRRTLRSVRRLLVAANVSPSSPILATLMMEALRSSDTSVLTRATRRNIPEDGISLAHWTLFRKLQWTPLSLLLQLASCSLENSARISSDVCRSFKRAREERIAVVSDI
jgi:hypothetical protein